MEAQQVITTQEHKVEVSHSEDKKLVTIKVTDPDGYEWSIERMPVKVAKCVSFSLDLSLALMEDED